MPGDERGERLFLRGGGRLRQGRRRSQGRAVAPEGAGRAWRRCARHRCDLYPCDEATAHRPLGPLRREHRIGVDPVHPRPTGHPLHQRVRAGIGRGRSQSEVRRADLPRRRELRPAPGGRADGGGTGRVRRDAGERLGRNDPRDPKVHGGRRLGGGDGDGHDAGNGARASGRERGSWTPRASAFPARSTTCRALYSPRGSTRSNPSRGGCRNVRTSISTTRRPSGSRREPRRRDSSGSHGSTRTPRSTADGRGTRVC